MGKRELGGLGESFVCGELQKMGYKILERNYRVPGGEIDIIVQGSDKTLVFVEVKTMGYWSDGIQPEDQMTRGKTMRFKRASEIYAGAHPRLIDDEKGWRCDVVAVTKIGNDFLMRHYENI